MACGGSSDSESSSGGSSGSGGSGGSAGAAGSAGQGGVAGQSGGAGQGGGSAGASGNAGAAGSGGTSYTLDNVCALYAPKLCVAVKPCCEGSGFGYDAAKCETATLSDCDNQVAEVKAGNLTFHPENIDTCLTKLAPLYQKCQLSIGDIIAAQPDLALCNMFEGKVPQGGPCTRGSDCAVPTQPNTYKSCNESSKTCEHTVLKKNSEPCELGTGASGFCESGLFCDVSLVGQPPYPGQCKPATPSGSACNTQKAISVECGLGFYCNKASGNCTTAKVGGAGCTLDLECRSFKCQGGKCLSASPIVGQQQCTG